MKQSHLYGDVVFLLSRGIAACHRYAATMNIKHLFTYNLSMFASLGTPWSIPITQWQWDKERVQRLFSRVIALVSADVWCYSRLPGINISTPQCNVVFLWVTLLKLGNWHSMKSDSKMDAHNLRWLRWWKQGILCIAAFMGGPLTKSPCGESGRRTGGSFVNELKKWTDEEKGAKCFLDILECIPELFLVGGLLHQ